MAEVLGCPLEFNIHLVCKRTYCSLLFSFTVCITNEVRPYYYDNKVPKGLFGGLLLRSTIVVGNYKRKRDNWRMKTTAPSLWRFYILAEINDHLNISLAQFLWTISKVDDFKSNALIFDGYNKSPSVTKESFCARFDFISDLHGLDRLCVLHR